ncbi:WG repeat-containing protein [Coprobacter tertius]|uniref:WG repeat-containing protein n=1 Tax=Coprobacter tertius TaxID=2944915 RepID=A0ABT1MDQ5_9BACT|nr:WG repeat-containing protein [Coprobacter tertius]MCP9610755.1 WG repeat-containing protein [Coprobacter tertius]
MNLLKSFLFLAVCIFFISCGSKQTGRVDNFSEVPVWSEDTCNYITSGDDELFRGNFQEASLIREDLALVRTGVHEKLYGFIGNDGSFVIPAVYKSATTFSEGFAWVVKRGEAPCAINRKGELKMTLREAYEVRIFREGLAAYSIKDRQNGRLWGFVNSKGETVINTQFSAVKNFSNGKAAVKNRKGKWGYIDVNGDTVVDFKYNDAFSFRNKRAIICENGKYGVIDENGKIVIEPEFSNMRCDDEWYAVEQNGRWGWCDSRGKIKIEPIYEKTMNFFGHNRAPVLISGKWGYVDKNGKVRIKRQFSAALPFTGDRAAVFVGKQVGFINEKGRFTINPQYERVSNDYQSNAVTGTPYYFRVISDHSSVK